MDNTQFLNKYQDNNNQIQGLIYACKLLMNDEQATDGRNAILDRMSGLACLSDELIKEQLS